MTAVTFNSNGGGELHLLLGGRGKKKKCLFTVLGPSPVPGKGEPLMRRGGGETNGDSLAKKKKIPSPAKESALCLEGHTLLSLPGGKGGRKGVIGL